MRELSLALDVAKEVAARAAENARTPYRPPQADWPELYRMLCGHCAQQLKCHIVEAMIEMKENGTAWPEGGWVHDPGARVSCLSYEPKGGKRLPRQQLRYMLRQAERDLPAMCGGCAARKGSEASVSLHTRRDYQAAVQNRTVFVCHEDPEKTRLCGGWCRAVRRRSA